MDTTTQLKNDGGPAFPATPSSIFDAFAPIGAGLTIRDWFAGQASTYDLSQMIPNSIGKICEIIGLPVKEYKAEVHYVAFIIALRYRWADAMLAEREKGRTP